MTSSPPPYARPADVILALLMLVGAGVLLWLRPEPDAGTARLLVVAGGRAPEVVRLPSSAATHHVRGPLGTSTFEVSEAGCRMVTSPCPLHLCVRSGTVRRPGASVLCLPNRVALILEASGEDDLDGIAR